MTVQNITQETLLGGLNYLIVWDSTESDPTYFIYLDGGLVATTTKESYIVALDNGQTIDLFIADDIDDLPPLGYPDRIVLRWARIEGSTFYRVQEFTGVDQDDPADWTTHVNMPEIGRSEYIWQTPRLPDDSLQIWRVVAFDGDAKDEANVGNDSVAFTTTTLMVRRPNAQNAVHAYDGVTGDLTITAVAAVSLGGDGGGGPME